MKKTLSVILALVMAFTLVFGLVSIASAEEDLHLPSAQNNGAYVKILALPESGGIKFDYGWYDTRQFAAPAVGYWLGLYDITNSSYLWSGENQFTTAPAGSPGTIAWNNLKLSYQDTAILAPGQYSINFFVRSGPDTNVAVVECKFSTQSITVTSPKESSHWAVGSTQPITWTSVGVTGDVNIELSRDDGATWTTIIPATANDGSEDWLVTGPGAKDAKIRVVSIASPTVSDESEEFSIVQSLNVTSPRESSRWTVGSSQTITWTSVGVTGNVNITLSRDGGTTWEDIVLGTPNDGTEVWTVTGPVTQRAIIKVASVDISTVSDTSQRFTIR